MGRDIFYTLVQKLKSSFIVFTWLNGLHNRCIGVYSKGRRLDKSCMCPYLPCLPAAVQPVRAVSRQSLVPTTTEPFSPSSVWRLPDVRAMPRLSILPFIQRKARTICYIFTANNRTISADRYQMRIIISGEPTYRGLRVEGQLPRRR